MPVGSTPHDEREGPAATGRGGEDPATAATGSAGATVRNSKIGGPELVLGLVRACHPGPTVTVTAIVVSLALGAGQRWAALPMGAAVLTGQLSVGWSNDVLDEQRDRLAGRLDKPIAAGDVPSSLVKFAIAGALVLCTVLSLALGWVAGAVHLLAVAAGWAYNLGLKSSPFSVLPYAMAFAAVPAFVSLSLPGHPWPAPWAAVAASLLGGGAHFVNVLPDLERDRVTGVRGLPQRLDAAGSLVVGALMMAGSLLMIALNAPPVGGGRSAAFIELLAAAALIGMILAAVAGARRLAWRLALLSAATVTAAFLITGASALR